MQIEFVGVDYVYENNFLTGMKSLDNINLKINSGCVTAIIGKTGSGKSTLIQQFNGILQPSKGFVRIGDIKLEANKKCRELYELRKKVGVVYQFPENQLFEETVEEDISFGPKNYGVGLEQCKNIVRDVIRKVGLAEDIVDLSPFELSGGQKRRVAIAGILAMEPEILVLDEPTVGLDPRGCKEIMEMLYQYHKEKKCTMIFVSHSMEDVTRYADRLVVLDQGTIVMEGVAQEVFIKQDVLHALGLDLPNIALLQRYFEQCSGHVFLKRYFSEREFVTAVACLLKRQARENQC